MGAPATRIFRDPVHGNIAVPSGLLLELIDSPEFQRLRHIRQLGLCFTTFHGAEHSRFQHALGVMWLMLRVLQRWESSQLMSFAEHELQSAAAAALLHDVGHGPFSHALERIFVGLSHEAVGRLVIKTRLRPVFERHGVDPEVVCQILEGTYRKPVFHELIASELDVDRMDYLLRDSFYTGVKYGLFDCERILDSLTPWENVLALERKGVEAVEEFLFSRYFMHWQVYFHRTVRSAELMLRLILERARQVWRAIHIPHNLKFLFEQRTDDVDALLEIDDFDIFHAIKAWQSSQDPVLSDLSRRLMHRNLFKGVPHPGESEMARLQEIARKKYGEHARYYLRDEGLQEEEHHHKAPIRVLPRGGGEPSDITQVTRSKAVEALGEAVRDAYVMMTPELRAEFEKQTVPGKLLRPRSAQK